MTAFKTIYIEPDCPHYDQEGRMWCSDDMGPCDECGLPCLEYVLVGEGVRARIDPTESLPSNENVADQPT